MTPYPSDDHQFYLTPTTTTTLTSHTGRTSQRSKSQQQQQQQQLRPPPLARRNNPSPGTGSSTVRLSKSSSGSALLSPTSKRRPRSDNEKFDMATGFLPFCANCEKQIMTPHNSVLYCSQSCQKQDSRKPLAASSISLSPAPTPPSSPAFYKSIIPPLEPTKLSPSADPSTASSSPKIPNHTHDLTSDLDPSEWNPSLARHSGFLHHTAAEAFSYFSPSHCRAYSIPDTSRHGRNPSLASLNPPPSLSNSPSASPSPSPSPSPTLTHATPATRPVPKEHKQNRTSGLYRPLPPLHKPSLSSARSSRKSVELVMPQAGVQLVA